MAVVTMQKTRGSGGGITRPAKRRPEPEPEPESQKASDAPDYTVIVGLRKSKLPEIASRIQALDEMKKEIEGELKTLKEEGAELLQRADVKVVMAGGLRVTRVDGSSVHLSKTALVELGVDETVIQKATKVTKYTTLKVTAPKEE